MPGFVAPLTLEESPFGSDRRKSTGPALFAADIRVIQTYKPTCLSIQFSSLFDLLTFVSVPSGQPGHARNRNR